MTYAKTLRELKGYPEGNFGTCGLKIYRPGKIYDIPENLYRLWRSSGAVVPALNIKKRKR